MTAAATPRNMTTGDAEPTPDELEQQLEVDPAWEEDEPAPDAERVVPDPDPAWDEPSLG